MSKPVVTPVEERIDHEAARRRLSAWRYGEPGVYHTDAELKADITALLTEHFALRKEHAETQAELWKLQGDPYAALPATEPAQPEEEPDD